MRKMWSIHFLFFLVVCLICVSLDRLYHALPLANNATNLNEEPDPQANAPNLGTFAKKDLAGSLRMFPALPKILLKKKTQPTEVKSATTRNLLQLWANPQEGLALLRAKGGGNSPARELTIPIPKFNTDVMGNWVFNPWAVTYGDVWMDTRFNRFGKPIIPRITVDNLAGRNYYPAGGEKSTVCLGRSTIYNIPRVEKWLEIKLLNHGLTHRPFFIPLRREIYEHGRSEECHTKNFDDWRKFQECTIRRNMRVEYMIPKYPLHQIVFHYDHMYDPDQEKDSKKK